MKKRIIGMTMIILLITTLSSMAVFAAGSAKPDVEGLGEESTITIIDAKLTLEQTGQGLLDGVIGTGWKDDQVGYWNLPNTYLEFEVTDTVNIWRSGHSTWDEYSSPLSLLKYEDGSYIDVSHEYEMKTTSINQYKWEKWLPNLKPGRYKLVRNGDGERLDAEWYVEKVNSASQNTILDIEAPSYEINGGSTFETFAVIKNADSTFAEDMTITYDQTLFELVSAVPVNDIDMKIYHEITSTKGLARYIIASKGADNGLSGDNQILKLTFRAKNVDGSGDITITSGLIADGNGIESIPSLAGKTFTITKQVLGDVNKDGNFTLGDLAIAGRLFASTSDSWDNFEPDVDANGNVEDLDLSTIVESILN